MYESFFLVAMVIVFMGIIYFYWLDYQKSDKTEFKLNWLYVFYGLSSFLLSIKFTILKGLLLSTILTLIVYQVEKYIKRSIKY